MKERKLMINEKELKNKLNKYLGNGEKRYLYRDAEYDPRGINYTPFLQLRFDTFNKNYIRDYTIEGWRILCYLITKAKDNKYITTTPSMIIDSLNMTRHKTISGLNSLFKSGIIIGNINNKQYSNKNKVKVINDKIEMLILYADNELYPHDLDSKSKNGYKALPLDFISRSILELDEYEWAILTFLIVRYRYFKPDRAINNDTGEITYYINEYMYAYPKQTDIADMLGCERKKLIKHIDNLEKLGYIKTSARNAGAPTRSRRRANRAARPGRPAATSGRRAAVRCG
jgi:hypothetical protein